MIDVNDYRKRIEKASKQSVLDSMHDLKAASDLINKFQAISEEPASTQWLGEKNSPDDVIVKYTVKIFGVPVRVTALYKLAGSGYAKNPSLVKMDFID